MVPADHLLMAHYFKQILMKRNKPYNRHPPPLLLTVTVNGDTIEMDTFVRLDISNYFSPCQDQKVQLRVDTDAPKNQQNMLNQVFTLPKMIQFGHINLFYDELSKIVRVLADEGTLVCAGNSLEVRNMDNSKNIKS